MIGNGMGWDKICQSQSCPVYANEIKKSLILVPLFFFGQKYVLISSQSKWNPTGSHPNRKNYHPYTKLSPNKIFLVWGWIRDYF